MKRFIWIVNPCLRQKGVLEYISQLKITNWSNRKWQLVLLNASKNVSVPLKCIIPILTVFMKVSLECTVFTPLRVELLIIPPELERKHYHCIPDLRT